MSWRFGGLLWFLPRNYSLSSKFRRKFNLVKCPSRLFENSSWYLPPSFSLLLPFSLLSSPPFLSPLYSFFLPPFSSFPAFLSPLFLCPSPSLSLCPSPSLFLCPSPFLSPLYYFFLPPFSSFPAFLSPLFLASLYCFFLSMSLLSFP